MKILKMVNKFVMKKIYLALLLCLAAETHGFFTHGKTRICRNGDTIERDCDICIPSQPGVKSRWDCNYCTCFNGNLLGCTKMGCRPDPCKNGERLGVDCFNCPEEVTIIDGNRTCKCQDRRVYACGNRKPRICMNGDTIGRDCDTCTEGTRVRQRFDCNSCSCGNGGILGCTKIGCPPKPCKNGYRLGQDCYSCPTEVTIFDGNRLCKCHNFQVYACGKSSRYPYTPY